MTPPGTAVPKVARGFDRLAPIYDPLADLAFAGRIHASQIALLPKLHPARRVLVMGGGNGRFLCELLASGHADHAVSIDASSVMTERTRAALRAIDLVDRADLRVGGLETLGEAEHFDLIVTHCYLDLFEAQELDGVLDRLSEALLPKGQWLFSDFTTTGEGLPRIAKRAVVTTLYTFFRLTCGLKTRSLPDFDAAFVRRGFREVAKASAAAGLLKAAILERQSEPGGGSARPGAGL